MDLNEEFEEQLHVTRDDLRCKFRTAVEQLTNALSWKDVVYYGTNAPEKVLSDGNLIPNDDGEAHLVFRLEADDAVIDAVFNASGDDRPAVFIYDRKPLARSVAFDLAKEDSSSRVELIVRDKSVPLGLGLIAMVSVETTLEWLALDALKQVASGELLPMTNLHLNNARHAQA